MICMYMQVSKEVNRQSSKVYNPIKNEYVRGWPSSSQIAEKPVELLLSRKDKNAITEHMYFRCRKLWCAY
jgi:hypothetical protein